MKKMILIAVLLCLVLPAVASQELRQMPDRHQYPWSFTHKGFTMDQWERFDLRVAGLHAISPGRTVSAVIEHRGVDDMSYTLDASFLFGATDSEEECASETDQMCTDAGHGGGSGNSALTQHALADGGGCTCTQTCANNGAIAFVDSDSACGTA